MKKKYILEVEYDDENLLMSITVLQLMHDLVGLMPKDVLVRLIIPEAEG